MWLKKTTTQKQNEQISLKPLFCSAAPLRLFCSSHTEQRHWAELISSNMKEGEKRARHETDTDLQLQSYRGVYGLSKLVISTYHEVRRAFILPKHLVTLSEGISCLGR